MSRIEEALQKASMNREKGGVAPPVQKSLVDRQTYAPPPISPIPVDNPFIVTVRDPHSPASEEFRKLKSLIVGLSHQENPKNCILITSALMGEGKSITSLNLAITLAQEFDHTVLLIDADLRKPSLHSYLGLQPEVGLSECLTDGRDVGDCIIRTGLGKLSLLPGGKALRNPTELLSAQKTRDLFTEIKGRYDDRFIIIDTPPVLPFAETRAMATIADIVDSIVFVVREGVPTPVQVKDALHALKKVPCLGIVYNDARVSPASNYGYYYAYGSNDRAANDAGKKEAAVTKRRFRFPFTRAKSDS